MKKVPRDRRGCRAMSDFSKEREEDVERLDEAVRTLMEFFDACHIFASRCESGMKDATVHVQRGGGNWFARYGQVQLWVEREAERERDGVRQRENE